MTALAKKQAIAEAIEANQAFSGLGPIYLDDRVQVDITDEGVRAYVEHDGEEMTVNAFTKMLREACDDKEHPLYDDELPRQFRSLQKSGGGVGPGVGGSGHGKPDLSQNKPRRSQMTTRDKVAFVKEHGEAAFMELPA